MASQVQRWPPFTTTIHKHSPGTVCSVPIFIGRTGRITILTDAVFRYERWRDLARDWRPPLASPETYTPHALWLADESRSRIAWWHRGGSGVRMLFASLVDAIHTQKAGDERKRLKSEGGLGAGPPRKIARGQTIQCKYCIFLHINM